MTRHPAAVPSRATLRPSFAAGPVRPAYGPERPEGRHRAHVEPRPPRPRGRWRFRVRDQMRDIDRTSPLVPPAPDPDVIVDPRIGARGPALLALEDGSIFAGIAFGADLAAGGDLVVNTSQTGYQEVCTDPSYAGQVVVMTYPLIGNHGRLRSDDQSERPWLRALVVANATAAVLEDARQLATLLREWGITAIVDVGDPAEGGPLVAIVDLGLKANIVRSLRRRGARIRILPHSAPLEVALASDIDGLVFSPGPGDPARLAGPVPLARAA